MQAAPRLKTAASNLAPIRSSLQRFIGVGAAGFCVDAAVMTLLIAAVGWGPLESRAVSFPAAVTVTWQLNRWLAFPGRGPSSTSVEFLAYAGIQVLGAIVNVGVFVACLRAWPVLTGMPVVALAVGAAVALVFNYCSLRWVLYRRRRSDGLQLSTLDASSGVSYSGADNLEVMAEAVRYNAYLVGLVRACLPGKNGRILDFGAGSGTFALPLHREGRAVTCVEPDSILRRLLEKKGLRATQALPDQPDGSFALIYSLNVLEHIQDDLGALVSLRRHLAPGGTLMIYVPAFQLLYSSMDRKVGHFRRYRRAGLMQLLAQAGYEVQSARYVDSLGFLAALAYRFLGRNDGTINRTALAAYDRWVFPLSLVLDHLTGRLIGKNLVVISRVSTR